MAGFHRVLFPQMMRFALPGIGNNWQVLIKATALVSIIGLTDIVKLRKMRVEVPCNCSFQHRRCRYLFGNYHSVEPDFNMA